MRFHLETINEFETILNCLDSNNNNLIRALSLFAEEHKENKIVAPAFVNLITTKIIEAPQNLKIYFLYVLDCIVKNVGYLYIDLFAKSLKEIFILSLSSVVDVRERPKYYLMRKSWENYFIDDILNDIDLALNEIDPNWRNEISISITDIAIKPTSENNYEESLQSLPIISHKAKFDNYFYSKDSCTPYIDGNKENENLEFPIIISRPIWKVDIPEYPLFPDIGTDPRLLRQWYTNEITQRIVINNRNYELLLNRIQPCIFVNETLHAVRFYSKKIQLIVNDNLFDISISGASLIKIFDQSFYVCLGGPWHEFIVMGLPYNIPFDGQKHRIRFNNDNLYLQWVTSEHKVQVEIMPGIPSHISEWGWRGMFGSPKYLTQRPLNPMKPPETFMRSKMNNKSNYNKLNKSNIAKENQKIEDWKVITKIPLEVKENNLNFLKKNECDNFYEEFFEKKISSPKITLNSRQKLNREVICQLYSSKKCPICNLTFSYTDETSLATHFLQYKSSDEEQRYQLLTDWIVSDFSVDDHQSNMTSVRPDQIEENSPTKFISFDDLVNLEINTQLALENGNIIVLSSEEFIRFYSENRVIIRLIKGTAEIHGTALPFNSEINLVNNNNYEILSFTGCKLCVIGNIKDVQIKSFSSDFYKPNILLNIHHDLELKRIEASEIEGRGPRILIYGPGVEAFSMSTLTRTLGNYAVRSNRTVALVNLDTIYNDTGLPNSISVNVIHTEFDIHHWWDPFSEPLVFNFGQCSPVANRHLYFEQLDALANYVNIRCENDNNLLIGGCIINGGSFHSSEIIMKAIQLFEVNFLLFISDKDSIKLNSQVPEYVQVINIPKNLFDTNFCPKKIEIIRTDRIDTYFNGNILIHKLYQHILKADKIKVFYTKSLNDSNGSNFIHIHFSEILNNSVGAISQALTPDKISTSPILLYLLITDISEINSTVTVMTERKFWPDCYSILLLNGIVLENK